MYQLSHLWFLFTKAGLIIWQIWQNNLQIICFDRPRKLYTTFYVFGNDKYLSHLLFKNLRLQ